MKKNILICFDGTSNDPSDANEENSKSEDNSISNVLKLHLLAGGDLENRAGPLQGQESYYYSGVGTRGRTRIRRLLSAGLAIREPKLIRKAAKTDLAKTTNQGTESSSLVSAAGLPSPACSPLNLPLVVSSKRVPELSAQSRHGFTFWVLGILWLRLASQIWTMTLSLAVLKFSRTTASPSISARRCTWFPLTTRDWPFDPRS